MPYAMKQRADAFKEQTGKSLDAVSAEDRLRLAHYTSADSALKIINSKRIWMRNASCMSDYSEVQHGFDILQRYFRNRDRAGVARFSAALDACAPGVAQEAIQLFDQWWAHPQVNIPFNTYITSSSLHAAHEDRHGRLSMWRAFGGQSTPRVAFVFSIPAHTEAANALNILFSPVAYLPEDQVYAVIEEVISNVHAKCEFLESADRSAILGMVFHMFLAGVTCLKHEGFNEEREWRAIYSPKRASSPLMESSIEVIGGLPQPVYKIPLDVSVSPALATLDFAAAFDRLIIGPSPYPWPMFEAFVAALINSGISDAAARVCVSEIPIRS
jgi:hypothetical protein